MSSLLDLLDSPLPDLHNGRVACVEVQTEKPWHRTAAYLLSCGKTQIEVAEALDKTPQMVSILLGQEWFQRLVTELIHDEGGNEVAKILRDGAVKASLKLVEITTGQFTYPDGQVKQIKPEIALSGIKDMLDRHLGKAPQHIEYSETKSALDPQEELLQLNKQLATLRGQN